jgi:hypothetical protein
MFLRLKSHRKGGGRGKLKVFSNFNRADLFKSREGGSRRLALSRNKRRENE